jgi:hypothetical protein
LSKKQKHHTETHQHYYRESSTQIEDPDLTDEYDHEGQNHQSRHSASSRNSRQHTPASSHPQAQTQPQDHALLALFGTDLDKYVAQHMQEYDTEKEKWVECEMEEWVKGADGTLLRF